MEPYYTNFNTHGTVDRGMGVNADGIQLFGQTNGGMGIPERMTLWKIIQEKHVNLWGLGADAATAQVATPTDNLLSYKYVGGLAVSYVLGRYLAVPMIEYFSGSSLGTSVKTGVGITAMIL
jgi:hypothetical protein